MSFLQQAVPAGRAEMPSAPGGTERLGWGLAGLIPNPGYSPRRVTVWFGASSAASPV